MWDHSSHPFSIEPRFPGSMVLARVCHGKIKHEDGWYIGSHEGTLFWPTWSNLNANKIRDTSTKEGQQGGRFRVGNYFPPPPPNKKRRITKTQCLQHPNMDIPTQGFVPPQNGHFRGTSWGRCRGDFSWNTQLRSCSWPRLSSNRRAFRARRACELRRTRGAVGGWKVSGGCG